MTELGPAARSLIVAVGHADDPSEADHERVRRALMSSLGAVMVAGTTAGSAAAGSAVATGTMAAKTSSIAQLLLWFGMGAAGGVGVAVTAASLPSAAVSASAPRELAAASTRAREVRQPTPPSRAPNPPRAVPSVPVRRDSLQSPSHSPGPSLALEPKAGRNADPAPPAVAAFVEPEGALSDEVRLLQRAQQARANGECGQSLRWLDEYARRFPQGALHRESLAARTLCLCKLGRELEAHEQLERLRELQPGSPHVQRLLQTCAGTLESKESQIP